MGYFPKRPVQLYHPGKRTRCSTPAWDTARLQMHLDTTTAAPQLLEKGQTVEVIVEVVAGRDGGCLVSMAEAVILSAGGYAPNRDICVSYPSWRPDLNVALVSAPCHIPAGQRDRCRSHALECRSQFRPHAPLHTAWREG